ncbi:MAG: L-lactate dehydrogenase [bacterium]|nr:L-lactate dehydrogenase [bacterium]
MAGKVTIIGAGNVGTACAYALATDGTPSEVVLLDRNLSKAQGEIMDIEHGNAFLPYTEFKGSNNYKDVAGSDLVVITAGAPQKPGETRLDLLAKNVAILKSIVTEVKKHAPNTILLVVSNPVDVLTFYAKKFSGFPNHRVIGSGTVLDTARFRSYIAKKYHVNAHNVHAYVLGEHGDSSFPAISTANVGPVPLSSMPGYKESDIKQIHQKVITVVYDIIKKKGATNLAIATCVTQLVRAILNDTHEIFPVSSVLNGEYGVKDVSISTPTILGRKGIIRELELPMNKEEKAAFKKSITVLKKAIKFVK